MPMGKKDLTEKRVSCILQIAAFAGGNIVFGGAPKPGLEVPTHVALTAADFAMCTLIYHEYYKATIAQHDIIAMLGGAGLLVVVAGGGGYALAKGASGLIAEFTNFLGPLGWMASGLLAAGGTAVLGLCWMYLVDQAYAEGITVGDAVKKIVYS
jgi:hypothetical protein